MKYRIHRYWLATGMLLCTATLTTVAPAQKVLTLDLATMAFTDDATVPLPISGTVVLEVVNYNPFTRNIAINAKNISLITSPAGTSGTFVGWTEVAKDVQEDEPAEAVNKTLKDLSAPGANRILSFGGGGTTTVLSGPTHYKALLENLVRSANDVSDAGKQLNALVTYYAVLERTAHNACLSVAEVMALSAATIAANATLDRNAPNTLKQAMEGFIAEYASFCADPIVVTWFTDNPTDKNGIEKLYKTIADAAGKLDASALSQHVAEGEAMVAALSSPNTFIVRCLPVQAEADIVSFTVALTAKDGLTGGCVALTGDFVYDTYVSRGLKLDFGTGPMVLFQMNDESYRLEEAVDYEGFVLLRQNEAVQEVKPALSATMHLSQRGTSLVKPAGLIGFGLDMTDISNATFYFGGGTMVGRDPWLSIHMGVVIGQKEMIKEGLVRDQAYEEDRIKGDELTGKVFGYGWFVGVSFIWPKRQEQTRR